jgi:hypothetical protein
MAERKSNPLLTTTTTNKQTHKQTGGAPLKSPKTNVVIPAAQAILAPNVLIRSFVMEYKATKTREWEAAERRWRERQVAEEER